MSITDSALYFLLTANDIASYTSTPVCAMNLSSSDDEVDSLVLKSVSAAVATEARGVQY